MPDAATTRFLERYGGEPYQNNGLWAVRSPQGGTIVPGLVPESQWAAIVEGWKKRGYKPNPVLLTVLATPGLGAATKGLYALGAALNAATGGKTQTYSATTAVKQGIDPKKQTYSTFTQAASGYQSATPGGGQWGLPVANKATVKLAAETAKAVGDAAAEGLFGVSLTTLALGAAGVLGLGVVAYAATR